MSNLSYSTMPDLGIFHYSAMKPTRSLGIVFELASAIHILFVFGRII